MRVRSLESITKKRANSPALPREDSIKFIQTKTTNSTDLCEDLYFRAEFYFQSTVLLSLSQHVAAFEKPTRPEKTHRFFSPNTHLKKPTPY